ncbi:MAG TPA: DUF190 domain-containing protein [Tepidisphaeraceae bacterium]|jgi:hypothetical protein|nr:DUF190 domain-containing protein [Tepidisphaeraceae bacterium]
MSFSGEQVLLRVYLRSGDRAPHLPTSTLVLRAARNAGLAGATVLRGIMGLGSHGLIQESTWSISENVPVIVEIVDQVERIVQFVEGPLAQVMPGGLATLERAAVMLYRQRGGEPAPLHLAAMLLPLSTLPRLQTRTHMKVNENGILLRVFIGEADKFQHRPLYEAIVQKARELGLAGATVLRGSEGFGANSVVHRANLLEMSTDLPIVIEMVDSEEKIRSLLPHLEGMVAEGMITMEYVMVLVYRENPADGGAAVSATP